MQLSLCHLGYRPDSPKTLTLCPGQNGAGLPDRIPFYIRQNCFRMKRERKEPEGFSQRFPCPFDLLQGKLIPEPGSFFYKGELTKVESRWGTFWQADFTDFREPGSYQIETDWQISAPFLIAGWVYERLLRGFLVFLNAQRCGCEVPGVHPACHLDDGVLDSDGTQWSATGGWHDAGDFRKWLSLTQPNLRSLANMAANGPVGFRDAAREEIRWGNRLFHQMITAEGRIYEDVAGGSAPAGLPRDYDSHWWFENHPGCYGDASDNRWTDNRPHSGDERMVRTTYNPLVQLQFVELQMCCSRVLPGADGAICQSLAERAWKFASGEGHDRRTIFVAQELLAALELNGTGFIGLEEIRRLSGELLARQETRKDGLTGFFWERDRVDVFRSISFAALPVTALLRLAGSGLNGLEREIQLAREAVERFCEGYLARDADSNPFRLTPYGVFLCGPEPGRQLYRDAGGGLGVRTFMHPFNAQGIAHGTSSVVAAHAGVLAAAAALLGRPDFLALAECQIQWLLGHNTLNRSLFNGIGFRQPVAYGFRVPQIPEAAIAGFIGRPDDSPYLEESFAIEWNTLEQWDIPYSGAVDGILATAMPVTN